MSVLPNEVVGDAYTSVFAQNQLEKLANVGNRMAGHDGEAAGAAVMADAFEAAGLTNVTTTKFKIDSWWREGARITLDYGDTFEHEHEIIGLPGSPPGDIEAPLVDLGDGTSADYESTDVAGAVILVTSETPPDVGRWIHRNEKYVRAVAADATAFVFSNHVNGCLPATGHVGSTATAGDPILAVGVSKEVGAVLACRCERSDVTVKMTVDCRTEPATSQNVEAVVGPDTDEEVLLTAHVDAHDISQGARDNGAGCAVVAEVARLLVRVADDLETRVRVVAFGAEEIGFRGAHHWARTHDLSRVKAVVNVDGVAKSRTLEVTTNGFDALADPFETTTDDLGVPLDVIGDIHPHADQWAFVQRGVPAVKVSSRADSNGRGWGHTHADTLDKIDLRDLRDLTVPLAAAVADFARTDRAVEHADSAAIRASMTDAQETELRITGEWPWTESDD